MYEKFALSFAWVYFYVDFVRKYFFYQAINHRRNLCVGYAISLSSIYLHFHVCLPVCSSVCLPNSLSVCLSVYSSFVNLHWNANTIIILHNHKCFMLIISMIRIFTRQLTYIFCDQKFVKIIWNCRKLWHSHLDLYFRNDHQNLIRNSIFKSTVMITKYLWPSVYSIMYEI